MLTRAPMRSTIDGFRLGVGFPVIVKRFLQEHPESMDFGRGKVPESGHNLMHVGFTHN